MAWLKRGEIRLEWQEELKAMLIEAGTDGVRQSKLSQRFEKSKTADEVLNELEVLLAQNKVQKFIKGGRGRPTTIWRATTLILK